jgi:hypothetical protein
MNTCAECRFWTELDLSRGWFYDIKIPDGYKECSRLRVDENAAAYVIAQGADDDALMTRSDFGCVQFERTESMALNVFDRDTNANINAFDIDLAGLDGVEVSAGMVVPLSSVVLSFGKNRRIALFTTDRETFERLASWSSRLLDAPIR